MGRITIPQWKNIPAGQEVWNGFVGGNCYCTAPDEPGTYTLYELVHEDTNTHVGWEWVKDV